MMKEIEARHPTSTGAVFLCGMEQLERYDDHEKAIEYVSQTLPRDPSTTTPGGR
jgi:hypothetical protein